MGRTSIIPTYKNRETELEQKILEELDKDMQHTRRNIIKHVIFILGEHKDISSVAVDTRELSEHGFREKELALIDKAFEDTIKSLKKCQNRGRLFHLYKAVIG